MSLVLLALWDFVVLDTERFEDVVDVFVEDECVASKR